MPLLGDPTPACLECAGQLLEHPLQVLLTAGHAAALQHRHGDHVVRPPRHFHRGHVDLAPEDRRERLAERIATVPGGVHKRAVDVPENELHGPAG